MACVSTIKSNKAGSTSTYSEDISAYLPLTPIDTLVNQTAVINDRAFDTTLIITDRLDAALQLVNSYNTEKTGYIEGLTIQLYAGNDRSRAKEVQMQAYRHFPDSKPKIIFDQPNYKVRMESFYSQLEAYPVFKKVKSQFSKAILVPTRIKVNKK